MKPPKILALICGAACVALSTSALHADPVQVTARYVDDSPTDIVHISSPYLPSNYNNSYFYAGVSNFDNVSVTSNNGAGGLNDTGLSQSSVTNSLGSGFQGFCVDLSHLVWGNTSYTWQVGQLTDVRSPTSVPLGTNDVQSNGIGISPAKAAAISRMWAADWEGETQNATTAATFQIALWTLLYNYDTPMIDHTVFSGSEVTAASAWASAAWNDTSTPGASIFALVNTDQTNQPGQQQFSIAIVGAPSVGKASPVPLPSAAKTGFAFLAFLGFVGIGRRAFRKILIPQ